MPGIVLLLAIASVSAQTFEAAMVKPVAAGSRIAALHTTPGQLTGAATLKTLLMRAYALKDYQVAGPPWMESERYEVTAKIPEGATEEQVALMLRALIEERFHFRSHREKRQLPIYALTVAKGGPKLRSSTGDAAGDIGIVSPKFVPGAGGLPDLAPDSDVPRSFEIVVAGADGILYKRWGRHETTQQLADRLTADLGRAVVDRSGLHGRYDYTLTWAREGGGGHVPRTGPPPDQIESVARPVLADGGVSIFAALPSQLGLRLESGRAPIDVLVVDNVDRAPSM